MIEHLARHGVWPKRVRFAHPNHGGLWERTKAAEILRQDLVYPVEKVVQEAWCTYVYIHGYRVGFNTVMFEMA